MANLEGKVILITGATSGIGKVAATELAKMGSHLIIVGRNPTKTQATVEEIQSLSANQSVDMLLADLSSIQEVRQLAAQFKDKYQQLDILINNAGAMFGSREESRDGYEMTFAVNHLAHFLLTNLLLDVLHSSSSARIINVASEIHPNGTINFDDLQSKTSYKMLGAYAQSKLANILFTYELAQRLKGTHLSVNAMEPGAVATNLGRNNGLLLNLVARFLSLFLTTPEKGAKSMIYLASSSEVEGISGQYFDKNSQSVQSSPETYDQQIAKRLWDVSAELVNLVNT